MVTRADSKLCFVILERSAPSGEIKPRNSVFHIYKILRDISIPPKKKTKQSSTRLLDCFVFTKTFLFINSGRIICHVHKTLGNLIPIKSLVCHNDRFFKVYIIKIDKGFNRHQNI